MYDNETCVPTMIVSYYSYLSFFSIHGLNIGLKKRNDIISKIRHQDTTWKIGVDLKVLYFIALHSN